MQKLRDIGQDTDLTTEQGQYLLQQVMWAARRTFVGRKLMGIRRIDPAAQTYAYDIGTEVSGAAIEHAWPGHENLDAITPNRSAVGIPNIHKEFEIGKLDLASSRMSGTPLNTSNAESAAYKVAYAEDTMLIEGWAPDGSNYTIKGLRQTASINSATGAAWSTGTNIPICMAEVMGLLMADNIAPPYNIVVNPTNYVEALAMISGSAMTYLDWLKATIQGEVFSSPVLSESYGVCTKASPAGFFEYVLAEDVSVQTEIESVRRGENMFGRVYARGLPVVYDPNAICKFGC